MSFPTDMETNEILDQLDKIDERNEDILLKSLKDSKCTYKPWSREEFLRRLLTYRSRWAYVNDPQIGEINCCLNGWLCESNNILVCDVCRNKINLTALQQVDAENDSLNELPEKTKERLEVSLKEEHQDNCLWRLHKFPPDIYHLSVSAELVQVGRRFNSLSTRLVSTHLPEEMTLKRLEKVANKIHVDWEKEDAAVLLGIALTGWSEQVPGRLYVCNYCHRRLGVWNLQSEGQDFDVLEEHKKSCPWVIPQPFTDLLGWQQIFELLCKESIFQSTTKNMDVSQYTDYTFSLLQGLR
ncbi:mRNA export factor rsm1 [Schizosaccharomyces pombe]